MDFKKLNEEFSKVLKEETPKISAMDLNTCINVLYTLEDRALDDQDTNLAQIFKDARIGAEDYRIHVISDMTDDNGEAL